MTTTTDPVLSDPGSGDPVLLEVVTHEAPSHLTARGTLFVLTGPGETPEVYARFGTRLAVDAYRVVVISADDHLDPAVAAKIRALVAEPGHPQPTVLVGSDAGARAALQLSATPGVHAVVAAGLPVAGTGRDSDGPGEISARTACPNHRLVLQRGTRHPLLSAATAVRVSPPAEQPVSVPVLAVHGGADPISPLPQALAAYAAAGVTDVQVVDGGLHDILNDVTHRSVAATVVLFLERLRLGAGLPVVIGPAPAAA